ncbi:MAG: SH3 domain-containing protein, partial [Phototrophicaceae bacterium]
LPAGGDESETTISGAPVVSIAAPRPNASYVENVTVNIQASVTNAGEDIDRVEISVNDDIIATQTQPNTNGAPAFSVTQTWQATTPGSYIINVTAYRGDGTASNTASVTVTVISPAPTESEAETETPTEPQQPDTPVDEPPTVEEPTSAPTDPPPPTEEPEPPTPDTPTALFTTGINVRSGPGTNFNPPIGQFAANSTAEILSVNLDGSWLKVRYGSGEGWVYAPLVEVQGSIDDLPREQGPPPPPPTDPPPPTTPPQEATQPPAASQANLTGAQPDVQPNPPTCGVEFQVLVNFVNNGSEPTSGPAIVRFQDFARGEPQLSFDRQIPVLQPGQNHVEGGPMTITTFFNEEHEIRVTIDPDNIVPESNTADNTLSVRYTLQQGGC